MAQDQAYRKAEKKIEEARFTGATELDLSCRYDAKGSEKLTELPESLGQLVQLQTLGLSRNKLTALPESLGQLTQLQTLDLSHNRLTALPESLGQLTQLQTLNLGRNQLTALPESLGQLTQLQSLDVFGNKLTALPDAFSSLRALVRLRLGVHQAGNPLGEVPPVLRSLNGLTILTVSECQLKSLPEWMGELTQLSAFHATNNLLTTLPVSFGHFGDLEEFGLEDNPLTPELAAAYKQGFDAVKAYLRAKAKGTVVLNEAKLILIGEGEVGKTCLLDALRGEPWREHETTHGVEINPVVLTPPKGGELTLNGWDFGGQEVYRPTHQLFFTAPAVYLVVWKPREGVQQGAVEYWIETIKHRAGPEAKILVVATHGGPQRRQPDIEEEHLRGKYGKDTILGFFHVDSKPNPRGTRTGITKLKNAIARVAAGLPNVGREVPASWSHVLTAVRKRSSTDPYITYKQFQSLCRSRKVNHALAATYAGMLNEMGHAIHYTDDDVLGKYMILKPDWLAKAISFVLDDKTTRDRHGLVDHDHLSKLWSKPPYKDVTGYAKKLHPLFRGLMERFDLTYEVVIHPAAENGSGASLIAQLVPGKPPKTLPGWGAKPRAGDREQVQLCRIVDIERAESSNAEGLFYRLIVRLHKYSLGRENYKKSVHWQRGLMLDDGYNGRALIERVGNDVRITVRAAYPEFFLFELTKEVKWLVDHPKLGWPGLRCDVMVPCIEPCGLNKAGYGLFEVEKLIVNTQKGIPEVLCTAHGCSQVHPVAALMTNAPGARRTRVESLGEKVEDVHDELRAIRDDLKTMSRKGDWQFATLHEDQRRLLSQTDEQFEALMQTLSDEARNGPRLFSFVPVDRNFFNLKKWTTEKFRLTLWCEHSRLPLPSEQLNGETSKRGVYVVEFPREWFVKAAPYLKFMGTTLGMVLPVVSPAAKVLTDDATYKRFGEELELGIKCAQSVLKGAGEAGGWLARSDDADFEPGDPMRAQDDVLREFHSILKKKDPGFGGLVRVQNKRHEFLWVHKKFAGEY